MKLSIIVAGIVVLVLIGFVVVNYLPSGIQIRTGTSGTLWQTDPFKGTFEGSDKPKLNSTIKVIFSLTPDGNMNNVNVRFYLPIGVTLLQGETKWNGNVISGQKIELPIEVKIGTGENYIGYIHVQVSGYEKDAVAITERSYYYKISSPEDYGTNETAIPVE